MDEYKFDGTGPDAVYLANVNMFFAALFSLAIFQREDWPHEKLGSQSVLQKCIDWFRQMFEGGLTGNRFHIASRNTARKELDVRIKKILHYLAIFADESDIEKLLNSGVVTKKSRTRARRRKPAPVN